MKKKIIGFLLVSLFIFPALVLPAGATDDEDFFGMDYVDGTAEGVESGINLGNKDPRTMAAGIINTVLTLLGIVAVVIVLLGGFKWMTAAGNEEKVGEAKKLLGAGIIGLVIILAAWGIATFILDQLMTQTGVGGDV